MSSINAMNVINYKKKKNNTYKKKKSFSIHELYLNTHCTTNCPPKNPTAHDTLQYIRMYVCTFFYGNGNFSLFSWLVDGCWGWELGVGSWCWGGFNTLSLVRPHVLVLIWISDLSSTILQHHGVAHPQWCKPNETFKRR